MAIDGTNWGELWDAVKKPDPFDVCFGDFCYGVPGWGSPWFLALGIIEILWWLFLSAWIGRRLKRLVLRHRAKRRKNVEADRSHHDPY